MKKATRKVERIEPEVKIPEFTLEDLKVCNCGRVWHLEKMKDAQHDWNRFRQIAKCDCGIILFEDRS